ncbi:MAG: RNA polymerase sigma factor [Isosphaerales bacterium]
MDRDAGSQLLTLGHWANAGTPGAILRTATRLARLVIRKGIFAPRNSPSVLCWTQKQGRHATPILNKDISAMVQGTDAFSRPGRRSSAGAGCSEEDFQDQVLIDRTARGDRSAFDALVRRHYGRAIAVAIRCSKNSAYAQDIVADAFVKAYTAAPRFRGQCRFTTWLNRIVMNTAYDSNDQMRKHETLSLDEALRFMPWADRYGRSERASAVADFVAEAQTDRRDSLLSAFRRLPAQDRDILMLRYDQDVPYEALAARFGVALGTVKSRLHRARQHLRSRLAADAFS